jgi:integrase
VRARYRVMYETSLRPETLDLLSVPEHFTRGATHITITDEIDKARFGRQLPLTRAARAALDAVCPDVGLVFGHFTNRKALRAAALKAGIDAARAGKVTPYDFRRATLTHLADAGKSMRKDPCEQQKRRFDDENQGNRDHAADRRLRVRPVLVAARAA